MTWNLIKFFSNLSRNSNQMLILIVYIRQNNFSKVCCYFYILGNSNIIMGRQSRHRIWFMNLNFFFSGASNGQTSHNGSRPVRTPLLMGVIVECFWKKKTFLVGAILLPVMTRPSLGLCYKMNIHERRNYVPNIFIINV